MLLPVLFYVVTAESSQSRGSRLAEHPAGLATRFQRSPPPSMETGWSSPSPTLL